MSICKSRRGFVSLVAQSSLLVGLFSFTGQIHAQSAEAKLRRTGRVEFIKLLDLRAVKRNGLLTVQATLQNDSSSGTPLNYRFKWVDDAGFKVWDDEPWKPENIFANQTIELLGIAPTPAATDFIIEINVSN